MKISTPRTHALALGIAAVLAGGSALAGTPLDVRNNGLYELDGNSAPVTLDDADDIYRVQLWKDCMAGPTPATCGPNPDPNPSRINERFMDDSALPDLSVHNPANKDILPLSTWGCVAKNNVTQKADLHHVAAAFYSFDDDNDTNTARHTLLMGAADRDANIGTTNLGMWLFQNEVYCDTTTGKFVGQMTNGDVLLVSDFVGGGKVSIIRAFQWQDPNPGNGTDTDGMLVEKPLPPAALPYGDCTDSGKNPDMCGTINTTGIDPAWPTNTKSEKGGLLQYGQFFEGAVDLDRIFPGFSQNVCVSSFLMETRSSDEPTASLTDFVIGKLNTCGEVRVKKVTVGNDGSFDFDTNLLGNSFDGTKDFTLTTSGGTSGWQTFSAVPSRTSPTDPYKVKELTKSDFELTDIQCWTDKDGNDTYDSSVDVLIPQTIGDRTAEFNLAITGSVRCVFKNEQPKLTVTKAITSCNADPGKFNLLIDSTAKATDVGNGGTTGKQVVSVGSHTVSETAGTGTSLNDYVSSIGAPCATDGSVTLAGSDDLTCTITNVRKPYVKVVKQALNTNGTADTGSFTVWVDSNGNGTVDGGETSTLTNGQDWTARVDTTYGGATFPGVKVGETGGATSHSTIISCDDGKTGAWSADHVAAREVTVNALEPGDLVTCRIVNVKSQTSDPCINPAP